MLAICAGMINGGAAVDHAGQSEPTTRLSIGRSQASTQLQQDGAPGLIYPSVMAVQGDCLVCFVPNKIQTVRPGASWDLVWQGTPEYSLHPVLPHQAP